MTDLFKPPQPIGATLAAGEEKPFNMEGIFVRLTASTGALKISFDLGQLCPLNLGLAYQCLPGQSFKQITIKNDTAAAITFSGVVGFMMVEDDRLNIVTAPIILPVTEPLTNLVGAGITALAAGASVALPGTVGAGQYQRAAVLVDNLDAASPLTIYDAIAAGNVAGYVLPGQSRYLPLSGPCRIANDTGVAINCAVAEIWELSP